jgi:hypothetical protein
MTGISLVRSLLDTDRKYTIQNMWLHYFISGFRKDAIQESCLEYDSFGPIPNITEIGMSYNHSKFMT